MKVKWSEKALAENRFDTNKYQQGIIVNWKPSGDIWGEFPDGVVIVHWGSGFTQPINICHLTDAE